MDRNKRFNEGGSSPEIGRCSSEEDFKRHMGRVFTEKVNAGESSSSLETIVGVWMEGKKKGRFGSLKKSFLKEDGLFKKKKKKTKNLQVEPSIEVEQGEQSVKGYKIAKLKLYYITYFYTS